MFEKEEQRRRLARSRCTEMMSSCIFGRDKGGSTCRVWMYKWVCNIFTRRTDRSRTRLWKRVAFEKDIHE